MADDDAAGSLVDQFAHVCGGVEFLISVVDDADAAQRFVVGREVSMGREHRFAVDAATTSDALKATLRVDAAGSLGIGDGAAVAPAAAAPAAPAPAAPADSALAAELRGEKRARCRVVTWNLEAKPTADAATLRDALFGGEDKYHVIHVGTQECERSIAASALDASKHKWTALLRDAAGPAYLFPSGARRS